MSAPISLSEIAPAASDLSLRGDTINPEPSAAGQIDDVNPSKTATIAVISSVTVVTGIGSVIAGIVTVAIPAIAHDISLQQELLLWPASIFSLTCGCTLLLSGAMADLFGSRNLYLMGCLLQSGFTLACGLSKTGVQLIAFRAFAGVTQAMCLPSAVSLVTHAFAPGKLRNVAFASMGSGQPLGFSIGLVLGGVFADTIGWRWGFYIAAALNMAIFVVGMKWLPHALQSESVTWERFRSEVDWVGALLATGALAMISYVFAIITSSTQKIKSPASIALIVISVAFIAAFILWVGRQEGLGKPAIIPNSLWRNRVFTTVCLDVFLVGGAFNAQEAIAALFFQYVQKLSTIDSSIRFLPAPAGGVVATIVTGLIVHRVHANRITLTAVAIACLAPLLLAITNPDWPYWWTIFPAMLTNAIGADVLYTISNLLVTSVFPEKTQATAGGVYNTIAQIGKSLGLASSAIIAAAITAESNFKDKESPSALLQGYRAVFWYCLGLNVLTLILSIWGLRKIGKVGAKRD
ncbi:integral membrane protein [Sarocladium strictum]